VAKQLRFDRYVLDDQDRACLIVEGSEIAVIRRLRSLLGGSNANVLVTSAVMKAAHVDRDRRNAACL